jgi:integrase
MKIINRQKGKHDTYVFTSKSNLDKEGNRLPYTKSSFTKQMKRIKEYIGTQDIDIRCFRASLTTHLREMGKGYEPSYLLGQALPGISNRVYTRSEFKSQKIEMTNAWTKFIEDCCRPAS